jgi:hypothetical protein
MDFIESWLGFSPDGGNGSLETFLLAFVVVVCAVFFRAGLTRRGLLGARPREGTSRGALLVS